MTNDEQAEISDEAGSDTRQEYIYFYHIKPQEMLHKNVKVYLGKNEGNQEIDEGAAEEVINRFWNNELDYKGDEVSDLPWTEPGYLIFVCEDPNVKLRDVTFHFGSEDGPDHSFGPTTKFGLQNDRVTVVFCKNLRRNWRGRKLEKGNRELFHVNFHFEPREALISHEETGTNTGP